MILSRLGRARKTIGDGEIDNRKSVAADLTRRLPEGAAATLRNAARKGSPAGEQRNSFRTPVKNSYRVLWIHYAGIKRSRRTRVIPATATSRHTRSIPKPEQGTSYGGRLGTLIRVLSIHEPRGGST